jgi:hypothetical protein
VLTTAIILAVALMLWSVLAIFSAERQVAVARMRFEQIRRQAEIDRENRKVGR